MYTSRPFFHPLKNELVRCSPKIDYYDSISSSRLQASHRLHDRMLKRVIHAPILFFNSNPVGRYDWTRVFTGLSAFPSENDDSGH